MRELSLQPITAQWYARAAVEYFFHFRFAGDAIPTDAAKERGFETLAVTSKRSLQIHCRDEIT